MKWPESSGTWSRKNLFFHTLECLLTYWNSFCTSIYEGISNWSTDNGYINIVICKDFKRYVFLTKWEDCWLAKSIFGLSYYFFSNQLRFWRQFTFLRSVNSEAWWNQRSNYHRLCQCYQEVWRRCQVLSKNPDAMIFYEFLAARPFWF